MRGRLAGVAHGASFPLEGDCWTCPIMGPAAGSGRPLIHLGSSVCVCASVAGRHGVPIRPETVDTWSVTVQFWPDMRNDTVPFPRAIMYCLYRIEKVMGVPGVSPSVS